MANEGGLRLAAKRTAFGDVSNLVNVPRPSKDDSAIGGKSDINIPEKIIPVQQDKRATSFLRPAQRPLSASMRNNSLSNVSDSSSTTTIKAPLTETQQSLQHLNSTANTRKFAAKESAATFKDADLIDIDVKKSDLQVPLISIPPAAPVHRELQARQKVRSVQEYPAIQPRIGHEPISHSAMPRPAEKPAERQERNTSSEEVASLRSDGIYIDEHGRAQLYDYVDPAELAQVVPSEKENLPVGYNSQQMARTEVNQYSEAPVAGSKPLRKSNLTVVSEPEEYWDDEGDENYEEEGYVTARSFKSRGENTTGGATTVLFPKTTLKAKKEIAAARELIEGSKTIEELEDEAWDTTMVAEYGEEIFHYMRGLEIKMLPNAHYMDNQAEIQWSMRAVLIDWIVQVHHRFNLLPETLFLCVNYIDRFLSCKVVSLGKLQLVGATAIFIAAKYEEIDCPSVQEIVYMVNDGYTVDEILKAERFMLSMLQFELGWPGPMSFLRRISKADDYDLETRTLAKYFLEITLIDERFVGSPPSFVAAGAHCLARMMLGKGGWSVAHVYYSNYTYSQLFSLVLLMVECCEDARKHHCAVYDKYTDKRYKRASHFAEAEMKSGFQVLPVNSSIPSINIFDEWHRRSQKGYDL
ncbi:B-type cyclin [Lecanora helva]